MYYCVFCLFFLCWFSISSFVTKASQSDAKLTKSFLSYIMLCYMFLFV